MTNLPRPLDALAAAANLAATYPNCTIAREAASLLRAYGLAHNAKLADRAAAMAQREEVAREIAERTK